jgi:Holliday junction DNA helicase RuvB
MSVRENDSILAGHKQPDDPADIALRPSTLDDLIGQEQVKQNLQIQISAAKQRGEALEHVLFYGPIFWPLKWGYTSW